MKAHLGLTGRTIANRFLVDERDGARDVPLPNRRLAIYRRCLMQVTSNISNLEKKLQRARSPVRKERWQAAIEFWLDLARYFETAIRVNCGERF
jgi:hypothetical protein